MTTPTQEAMLRMETRRELVSLGISAPVLTSRAKIEKVYEVFVLKCLLRALVNLGAALSLRDNRDRPTSTLKLRLGPGLLSAPRSAPGFVLVRYQNAEFEVQNSLRVLGQSRVLHELDVSLIEKAEADRCRNDGSDPLHTKARFLAECKFYGSGLPLRLGREYLGLCDEFGLRVKVIVSNVRSDDVHTLITKHRGTENFEISPWEPDNVTRFTKWIENELRQVLP